MELLYLWVEDYNCIKKQEFNFNPNYRFSFKPYFYEDNPNNRVRGGELIKEDLTPTIDDNFFGDHITNITAVVGKNGTGKSSLINKIFSFSNKLADFNSGLLIYKDFQTDKLLIYVPHMVSIKPSFECDIKEYTSSSCDKNNDCNNTSFIYLNHSFLQNHFLQSENTFPYERSMDISTSKLIKKNGLISFNNQEIAQQLAILNNKDINRVSINVPKNLHFEILIDIKNNKNTHFYDSLVHTDVGLFFHEKFTELSMASAERGNDLADFYKNSREQFFNHFILALALHYLTTTLYQGKILEIFDEIKNTYPNLPIEDLIQKLSARIISWFEDFKNQCRDIIKNEGENTNLNKELDAIEESILKINRLAILSNKIKELYDFMESDDSKFFGGGYVYHNTQNLSLNFNIVLFDDGEYNYNLIDKLCNVLSFSEFDIFPHDYIKLSWWQFSSGEQVMLNTFSRLYHIKDKVIDNEVILLIDEGELYLHPQWQKRYINDLINSLEIIFENKMVQIILTSHSPFIVSDLPKEHVIFLDKSDDGYCKVVSGIEKQQTFGANIHTLFAEAFFLEDGLIGDFAKQKINDLISS